MMMSPKIVVEEHPDTYVASPLGIKGVVVGQGDTYEAAVADLKSALQFHKETFGQDALDVDPPILEAFIAEAGGAELMPKIPVDAPTWTVIKSFKTIGFRLTATSWQVRRGPGREGRQVSDCWDNPPGRG